MGNWASEDDARDPRRPLSPGQGHRRPSWREPEGLRDGGTPIPLGGPSHRGAARTRMAQRLWPSPSRGGCRDRPDDRLRARAHRPGCVAVILDTNAVSALLAGDEALGDLLAVRLRHHLPVIVIGEYRFGLLRSRYRERLGPLFAALIQESIVLPVGSVTRAVYSP